VKEELHIRALREDRERYRELRRREEEAAKKAREEAEGN
jgi:hypothetical protein